MKRLVASVFVALASISIVPPHALAAEPERTTVSFTDEGTFPADVCGYALGYDVEGRVTMRIFHDEDGVPTRAITTGPIHGTFTNDETGAESTFSLSGPGFYDGSLTLVRGTGNWASFSGEGDLVITSGDATLDGGAGALDGHTRSVCASLAG